MGGYSVSRAGEVRGVFGGSYTRFHGVYEAVDVLCRVQGVQESVGKAVVPFCRDAGQAGVDVFPAFHQQQDIAGFDTAVEHGHVIKMRGVFNPNGGMICFQVVAETVVRVGISFFCHHEDVAV